MPGPVYKDSLGRCEAPSMLYDTVRNPHARYVKPKLVIHIEKDTIESTQKRLNREMVERFRTTGLNLPHESVVAVVQVGKYLFLAIMVPPYLAFYGLPRWLLMTALPNLIFVLKTESMRIGKMVQQFSKNITDLMKGLLQQMLGDALRVGQDRAKNLLKHFIDAKNFFANFMLQTKIQFKIVIQPIYYGARVWQETVEKAKNKIGKNINRLQERFDGLLKHVSHHVSLMSQNIQEVISSVANWLTSPILKSAAVYHHVIERLTKFVSSTKENIQNKIESIKEALRNSLNWVGDHTKRFISDLARPVVGFLEEKVEKAQEFMRHKWKEIFTPIRDVVEKIRNQMQEMIGATADHAKLAIQMIPNLFFQPIIIRLNHISKRARLKWQQKRDKANDWKERAKRLASSVKEGAKTVGVYSGKLLIKCQSLIQQLMALLLLGVRWLIEQLLALPLKIKYFMIRAWHQSIELWRCTVAGTQKSVAFLWGLTGYSLFLLQEMSNDLAAWLASAEKK